MSCIYGPHQFGTEDQGWVAHFLIQRARRRDRSRSTATACRCATCCSSTTWSTRSCARRRNMRRDLRAGVQHRRRAGEHDQPARAARPDRGAARRASAACDFDAWRRGRPALLRLGHAALPRRHRLGAERRCARASRRSTAGCSECAAVDARPARHGHGGVMKIALVNPPWSFDGSIYFGCREPHLPLEFGYARALLEARRPRGAAARRAARWAGRSRRMSDALADFGRDMTVVTTAPSYLFWRCAPPELRVPQETLERARATSRGALHRRRPARLDHPGDDAAQARGGLAVLGECEEILRQLARRPQARLGAATARRLARRRTARCDLQGGIAHG